MSAVITSICFQCSGQLAFIWFKNKTISAVNTMCEVISAASIMWKLTFCFTAKKTVKYICVWSNIVRYTSYTIYLSEIWSSV